jgi:hypothetical protein
MIPPPQMTMLHVVMEPLCQQTSSRTSCIHSMPFPGLTISYMAASFCETTSGSLSTCDYIPLVGSQLVGVSRLQHDIAAHIDDQACITMQQLRI